ncbi:SusC/RagA family TonB-linked outer membrane protein [Bacteroidia bacterium]|nr:SusC/RagA family TonB-linked outer membrane protein [Bacteroidia bacterium]
MKRKLKNGLFPLLLSVALPLTWEGYSINANSPQEAKIAVNGVVSDADGPIIGASVSEKGNSGNGVATDVVGRYTLQVSSNAVLVVSYLGYATQEVAVGGRTSVNVILEEGVSDLDEVVVVGYGTQKKATLTGAVVSIKNEDIITTKIENVRNMLTGKLPGLRVVQNSSEPGTFGGSIDIRGLGSPLVVIDGVPRSNIARLDAEDIESISVLKDASAAIYGVNAANGVILVTTKNGAKGKLNLSYSGNLSLQVPSNFPDLGDAVDWMTLVNERTMHNADNPNRPYSDAQIDAYRYGIKKSTDWKSEVFRESAPQTSHTLSATGGSDNISYYASLGYQSQASFLRTNAMNYEQYNLRSNVTAQITKRLRFTLNLAGSMHARESAVASSSDVVRNTWLMQPLDQVFYNEEERQYWQPQNGGLKNPAAMMNKDLTGENLFRGKGLQTNAALRYDFPLVKGLYANAMYSYDYALDDDKEFMKAYDLYDSGGKAHTWNSQYDAPNRVYRYFSSKNHYLWNLQIGFDRQFGEHNVSAMVLYEDTYRAGDNFSGYRQALFPINQIFAGITTGMQINQSTSSGALYDYAYNAYLGRLKYDYASKYLVEFTLRSESSSRHPANAGWATTPGISAGWRISEEGFFKNSPLNFIDNLKLRGSYGRMLDDSGTSDYNFLTGYTYPVGGNVVGLPAGSIFDGTFVYGSTNKGLANTGISWYKSDMLNFGVDFGAWNGLLGVTAEYFQRRRSGLLANRTLTITSLVGASQPQENLNGDLSRGFEIEITHRQNLGDFSYRVSGNVSYTRNKTEYVERAKDGNSYTNWRQNTNDRYNNIWWGLGANGRITSWDEIYYNPVFIGRGTVLGDYEYQDWNNDGQISDLDVHPLATNGQVPLIYYGITLSGAWKGFDLTMLWQGAGRRYVAPREFLLTPVYADTNVLTQFMDRWHPIDPLASPYDPSAQWVQGRYALTGTDPNVYSEFNAHDASYLRLKTIELGYTLPKKWLSTVGVNNVKIYVSAYNLLTFTGLKYLDPEFNMALSGSNPSDLGYNYPLNKTATVGINVKF